MDDTRPIMYATDFSAASRPAFSAALQFAKARRGDLIIVHVSARSARSMTDDATILSADGPNARTGGTRTLAPHHLDRLVADAKAAGVRATSLHLRGDDVAAVVVRAAREHDASLVVVGTHGRTGFKKMVLGSVAARLVATAPCPVLTVRTPEETP